MDYTHYKQYCLQNYLLFIYYHTCTGTATLCLRLTREDTTLVLVCDEELQVLTDTSAL